MMETDRLILRNMTENDYDALYNEASSKTAISFGCKQVDQFTDNGNEITKVYAVSREEWNL